MEWMEVRQLVMDELDIRNMARKTIWDKIDEMKTPIKIQKDTKLCPLMKMPCITDGCVAWGPIEKLNRNGCKQLER